MINDDANLKQATNDLGITLKPIPNQIVDLYKTKQAFDTLKPKLDALLLSNPIAKDTFDKYVDKQKAIDKKQSDDITALGGRMKIAETDIGTLKTQIKQAVGSVNMGTPKGTLIGKKESGTNLSGLKAVYFGVDVDAAGLAYALKDKFILKTGVAIPSLYGTIVGFGQ